MSNTVISIENLSKSYQLGTIGTGTFYNDLKIWWAKTRGKPNPLAKIGEQDHGNRDGETIWALRGVGFSVQQGEALGIIGSNGAGKSTLLKILSRVTSPTSGSVKVKGRIASLLEVGTGFHPELTGRENIYLNGAILGMTRTEVTRKFDEIVDFSGVEQFVDTPVKRYSSGMYVRLAFAVAAHLESEILIVDEVLAVGDMEFRRKCLGKMQDAKNNMGKTVLFVSHDMNQIRQLCTNTIWLKNGMIHDSGETEKICSEYEENSRQTIKKQNPVTRSEYFSSTFPGPQISKVELRDINGKLCNSFSYQDSFDITLTIREENRQSPKPYSAVWFLHNNKGYQIAVGSSYPMDQVMFQEETFLNCRIGPISLPVGTYHFRFVLHVPHYDNFDDFPNAISFDVVHCDAFKNGYDYPGIFSAEVFIPFKWESK